MANTTQAPIVLRAQRACLAAAVVAALLATGCNHRRRSVLRPVLPAPRLMAAPGCTDCGSGGSAVITEPAGESVIRREAPAGGGLGREPLISEPSGSLDSSVPLESSSTSYGSSTTTRRSSPAVETPPKATIDEPALDPVDRSTTRSRSLRPPADAKSPVKAPELAPPASSTEGSTSLRSTRGNSLKTASAGGVVRRASNRDELSQFFAPQAVDDLYFPNKADRPWKYVVVHHSATETGSYDAIDAEHRKLLGFDGCGYHFVIGNGTDSPDGQIEVSQRWIDQKHGVHCRNARKAEMDEYGVGVCLIGDFEKAPPTPRQIAALQALVAYLGERYRIEQDHVETHTHLAATPTVCPGRYFPDDALASPAQPRTGYQADAAPAPNATRRHVPTAWRIQGFQDSPALEAPVR